MDHKRGTFSILWHTTNMCSSNAVSDLKVKSKSKKSNDQDKTKFFLK